MAHLVSYSVFLDPQTKGSTTAVTVQVHRCMFNFVGFTREGGERRGGGGRQGGEDTLLQT